MPEMLFQVRWPDGSTERCYSPSLVVRDHLAVGSRYPLDQFMNRCRLALNEASERVRVKYGMPCSRALGQIARLELRARTFAELADAHVEVIAFEDQGL